MTLMSLKMLKRWYFTTFSHAKMKDEKQGLDVKI